MLKNVECRKSWDLNLRGSLARLTLNPVRKLVEQMKIDPNPDLPLIMLSLGDPTVSSELEKPETAITAIEMCFRDKRFDGYSHSQGTLVTRAAVAKYYSRPDTLIYKPTDIIITNGCSQAIDYCIAVLANKENNVLIPKPGFALYKTLCCSLGIDFKYYRLDDEKNWEIDLDDLESLIDEKTACIIVNNPSNPCGSVYSKQHLMDVINLAEKYKLPIIADEVYGEMAFPGQEFCYMSELSKKVPILSCNALSKRFMMPGWRFGWVAIHDPINCLKGEVPKDARASFEDIATRIIGLNTLIQGAVPYILENTPKSYFDKTMKTISSNANLMYEKLNNLPGLTPRKPSGAMYLMVGLDFRCFPGINSDEEFVKALVREQSVFCFPGRVFECPNYIRIVVTMKQDMILEACDRIEKFVTDHYVGN